MSEWQPIETAPKEHGISVILYWPHWNPTHGILGSWNQRWEEWDAPESRHKGAPQPTHWMPLPDPPKAAKPPLLNL